MKIGLGFMHPITFATWRCALAGIAMLPVLYVTKARMPARQKIWDYIILGLLQTTALFGLILFGIQFVNAGKTAVLLYTMPIWTSLIAHFRLGEKLSLEGWLGIASGTLGILSILGWDTLTQQSAAVLFGELMVILAAIAWALANIWMKTRMAGEDPRTANGLQLLIGTLGLIVVAYGLEGGIWEVELTGMSLFTLLFTGIVASAVNFTIWFYLLRRMNTHMLGVSIMLVPVFGILFDFVVLGTKLDFGIMLGGGLIAYGIYKVAGQR